LAEGGHRLRIACRFLSKTPTFRSENKQVTAFSAVGLWHGSCFFL
jgi:hypothetical protein